MRRDNGPAQRKQQRKSGLAPLELVMSLPLLLLVAALVMNIGVMATWRVRGEIVSRDEIWRSRYPRDGVRESASPTWPETAHATIERDRAIVGLENPAIQHAVVRGPLPNGFRVQGTLAPNRGEQRGVAEMTHALPLLPKLGDYESGDIRNPLLDLKWPCHEMGIPNAYRRTKRLYVLPATDQRLPAALSRAANDMFSIPHYMSLYALDRDAEILKYRGYHADFHPRIRHPYPGGRLVDLRYCELDREIVYGEQVTRLVDTTDARGQVQLGAISRLPSRMTDFFLRMYDAAISQLEGQIAAAEDRLNGLPRPTLAERRELLELIAAARAEIARIHGQVEDLEAYKARMSGIEEDLRRQAADYLDAVGPRP